MGRTSLDTLRQALANLVARMFPELGARSHLLYEYRITGAKSEAGAVAYEGPMRYSLTLEPIANPDLPPLDDVPLPVPWTGDGRGMFALPATGRALVAFAGGQLSRPYVVQVYPEGNSVAAVSEGEYLLQKQAGVHLRILPSNEIEIRSSAPVRVMSSATATVDAPTVHVGPGGNVVLAGGGPAVARVGDDIQIVGVQPGSATLTGKIISGSPKVTSG